jgi:hypothetical protein
MANGVKLLEVLRILSFFPGVQHHGNGRTISKHVFQAKGPHPWQYHTWIHSCFATRLEHIVNAVCRCTCCTSFARPTCIQVCPPNGTTKTEVPSFSVWPISLCHQTKHAQVALKGSHQVITSSCIEEAVLMLVLHMPHLAFSGLWLDDSKLE